MLNLVKKQYELRKFEVPSEVQQIVSDENANYEIN